VSSLQTNFRPKTCNNYRIYLRRLHRFLISKKISVKSLTRKHIAAFFLSLVEAGLNPGTRFGITICVRTYLRWLYVQRIIHTKPTTLVYLTDFPKRPSYLPRPLPATLDRELQARLNSSVSIFHKALLLMRYTGIRAGELVALPYACVFIDSRDTKFLKVPLGKLNNDRNVPLDDKAYKLLLTIQAMDSPGRPYLIATNLRRASVYHNIRLALHQIAESLNRDAPVTTHRLRHTYASSLLSAGASLFTIMKLLGHRDYHMTLRYAAVTQESVLKDYFAAIKTIDYATPKNTAISNPRIALDPLFLLDQAQRALKKLALENQLPPTINAAFLKKLGRLRNAIKLAIQAKP